ncbi:T-complex protein 1 subunit theta-like [Heptranchias perlo]|uniref:T-complex protein 1 subunit theta-like n=1 Tax=Heptranchias perlo TaxID=212740 RepID=UPI00355A40E0
MAAHVPKAPGYLQMLTSGAKYFSGLEEVVYRNIEACKELASSLRATYGPSGLNKLVISHLQKVSVTGDASAVLREFQIEQPAASMLVLAVKTQEEEVGDGRALVLILAGILLERAGGLLQMGLSVPEVIEGYRRGCRKALEVLESLECATLENLRDEGEVAAALRAPIMSKQYGYEGLLSGLVARACVSVLPESGTFDTDSVRVCKVLGAGVMDSLVLGGMVFKKETESLVRAVRDARVVIYSCPFELAQTQTKGTVLLSGAAELLDFSQGEEEATEAQVREIVGCGVTVVVVGGRVGDLALHYADKHQLMVVRLHSRYELVRLGRAVGATPLLKLYPPAPEEIGHCHHVHLREVGDTQVVVFEQERHSPISTILLRGSTQSLQDNIEEAIRDGVNTYKTLSQDKRLLPGAGATEIELALRIAAHGATCPGLDQYAIKEYAKSFELVAEALAHNTGDKEGLAIAKLCALHQDGQRNAGFDVEGGVGAAVLDAAQAGIWDPFLVKQLAIKLATNAAVTVLSVDQIIMAKKSGGPKPRGENPNWDEPPDHIE